ncbi:MAG: aminotransferase class V-fold PLP-dependent enzyme, partial [Alphaproteobacteria bacterium]|nr:aminotransferase class V-fold PLP-dependent enzyme [Alphaproteobacteria bacterium]
MNKSDFPIFTNNPSLIYLDNAASAQKPVQVIDAMENFMKNHYANVHRGTYYLSEMATIAYEHARHHVAEFLSVRDKDVIFVRGATEAINLVAQTYGRTLKAGDEILLSEAE